MQFNGDENEITDRARKVKLLLLDVDGVLTDGSLYFSSQGEEYKVFNSLDGHGIKLLRQTGVEVGIVSGRNSKALQRRVDELGLTLLYTGREDKIKAVKEIIHDLDISLFQIAFAGDDLPDLGVIAIVGLGITVPNAHMEVRNAALLKTDATGGHGAVREICDYLMQAQGHYSAIIDQYSNGT